MLYFMYLSGKIKGNIINIVCRHKHILAIDKSIFDFFTVFPFIKCFK